MKHKIVVDLLLHIELAKETELYQKLVPNFVHGCLEWSSDGESELQENGFVCQ